MQFTALLLFAAVAQVSAGNTAYYKVNWKKADNAWTVEIGATIAAKTANQEWEIVLPADFLCKPGAIPTADVTDAAPTASKVHCSAADGKGLTSLTCDTDGKKLKIKVADACDATKLFKMLVTKSHIFPVKTVSAKGTTLKVGAEGASTTDAHYAFMDVAAGLGANKGTSPKVTLSTNKIGQTGTFTYETTFPASPTMEKTDKICLFYPGFTMLDKASCSITADTTKAANAIKLTADAPDRTCLTIADTDQIPKVSKKFTVVCDNFKVPKDKQIALGFGVAFTDESDDQSDVFDALPGTAVTASVAPTRSPTAPTKAPTTKSFSAAPRSAAATGAAGFVSAVVAYFLF